MIHIKALINNEWIEEWFFPWVGVVVLYVNPCQEHITDIKDFKFIVYVSYYKLNNIAKTLGYHIPWCDDAVWVVKTVASIMCIITADYH